MGNISISIRISIGTRTPHRCGSPAEIRRVAVLLGPELCCAQQCCMSEHCWSKLERGMHLGRASRSVATVTVATDGKSESESEVLVLVFVFVLIFLVFVFVVVLVLLLLFLLVLLLLLLLFLLYMYTHTYFFLCSFICIYMSTPIGRNRSNTH